MGVLATQWLLSLFVTHFPSAATFRLFDCIFFERTPCVLIAVILALMRLHADTLCATVDLESCLENLRLIPMRAFSPDELFELALSEMEGVRDEYVTFYKGSWCFRVWGCVYRRVL